MLTGSNAYTVALPITKPENSNQLDHYPHFNHGSKTNKVEGTKRMLIKPVASLIYRSLAHTKQVPWTATCKTITSLSFSQANIEILMSIQSGGRKNAVQIIKTSV